MYKSLDANVNVVIKNLYRFMSSSANFIQIMRSWIFINIHEHVSHH